MTATIASLTTSRRTIPLVRPWGPDVPSVTVVVVRVADNVGEVGHGFSWTPSIGGDAVRSLLDDDIAPWAVGRPAHPAIWRLAWEHVHEAGGSGVTTIALAGLDLALWDLVCRRAGHGLDDELGRRRDTQPAYGSGINLHDPLDELVAQAERWVAGGFRAVKIKVGSPDLARDLQRVAAVRDTIGHDVALMLDANQRWDLDRATESIEALAAFDLAWMEEPLRADDTAGYVELRRRVGVEGDPGGADGGGVAIALGENAHHRYRFADLIDAGACDVVQPNIVRVGGITPFLDIVGLARDRGVGLAPHLLPELAARVAVCLPETTWVEVVEDAGFAQLGALARPSGVTVESGAVHVTPTIGIGLEFA